MASQRGLMYIYFTQGEPQTQTNSQKLFALKKFCESMWFTLNENGHLMLFTVWANSTLLLCVLNGHEWMLLWAQGWGPYAVHWLFKTPDHFILWLSHHLYGHSFSMHWSGEGYLIIPMQSNRWSFMLLWYCFLF